MKKTIRTILCAAVFAVAAVSCQTEIDEPNPFGSTRGTIDINIGGIIGEYTQVDDTKAELVNTVRVAWEGGETVYVFDGAKCLGSLAASLDENGDDRYARLSTGTGNTVETPAEGTKMLTLVYSPLFTATPELVDGELSVPLADQNGTKAPFVAYATLDYNSGASITDAVASFKFATSVIKVNCTGLKANSAITSARLSNVNTSCKLSLSGTAAPVVTGDACGTIIRTGDAYFAAGKVNAEGEAVFQIAVPVLSNGARILTVFQNSSMFEDFNFSQAELSEAISVNTVCQLVDSGFIPGKFTVSSDGRQVYFSKGNLWADATDPENPVFGFEANQYDYMTAWKTSHVSHFYWSKSAIEAVKVDYDDQERSGFDVFFTNSEDHAANPDFTVAGVRGKFRAVTPAEWTYIFANHSHKWVTINGIGGYVIAPYGTALPEDKATYTEDDLNNGNLVFIPAAGSRYGTTISLFGEDGLGYYWSSSASGREEDYNSALYLYFHSSRLNSDQNGGRDTGYSVRLVRDVTE